MRTAATRGPVIAIAAVIAAVLSMIISVGSASAVTLKGEWAPFNRCPVDDPAMLAASQPKEGEGILAVCLVVNAAKGSVKIGNLSGITGRSNTQLGLVGANPFTPHSPKKGAIVADPLQVPGGLSGLICPKSRAAIAFICTSLLSHSARLNGVTSTLESAGVPTELNLVAALEPGTPIITLPVKLHLKNPLLGTSCYIGSDADPILLHPATVVPPELTIVRFDADGTLDAPNEDGSGGGLMFETAFTGTSQTDTTFSVGKATGCGKDIRLNAAIDRNVGLPSPAGSNSISLDEVTSSLVGLNAPTATDGKDVAAAWHSAVIK